MPALVSAPAMLGQFSGQRQRVAEALWTNARLTNHPKQTPRCTFPDAAIAKSHTAKQLSTRPKVDVRKVSANSASLPAKAMSASVWRVQSASPAPPP